MYDTTHIGTFQRLKEYLETIQSIFGIETHKRFRREIRQPFLSLIGSKTDLLDSRTITFGMHNDFYNKGKFNTQLTTSLFKRDVINNWILSMIAEVADIQIEKSFFIPIKEKVVKRHSIVEEVKNFREEAKKLRNDKNRGVKSFENDSNCLVM